jgi:hypothetical protein
MTMNEVKMKYPFAILLTILAGLLLFSGCSPARETPPGVAGTPENLIIVTVEPQVTPRMDFVAQPPGAPVRPNASRMQVEVLSLAQSEDNPDYTILHVLVFSTAPAEGLDEYASNLAGQEIEILLAVGDAVSLAPGDLLKIIVSYRGDEWGSSYYGSNVSYVN